MKKTEKRLDKNTYIGKDKHLSIRRRYSWTFPLHAHEYFEVEIVLEGNGLGRINGKEYALQRGSVSILSPSDFHEVIAENNTSLMAWNIAFDETVLSLGRLEALFSKGSGFTRLLDEATLKKVDTAAELLRQEAATDGCIRPLTEYLLTLLMNTDSVNELSPMRKAILYVETHFRENPSLADAAKQACLSPVYFGNLFKQITGETYVNYLNLRKVTCAAMLLESGFSVAEACFSSGFGSLSGFLHTFKQQKGVSPEAYKQMHKKQ
jgi:AraC-like DNA-binding protein